MALKISWIVSHRVDQCHVSMSHLSVIRDFMTHCRKGRAQFQNLPRETRRELLTQIVARHNANRDLFNNVMSGRV